MANQPQFISEPLTPEPGSFDASAMARGEPGLPARFVWRGQTHALDELLEAWVTSSTGRGEKYLRRHWYRIRTAAGITMTVYCERQPKPTKSARRRWWVYTIEQHP